MNLVDLIERAGLQPDALAGRSYRCSEPARLVPINQISLHSATTLQVAKLEQILDAIAGDVRLPPIQVSVVYALRDGHHRLAISEALGAASVPVVRIG
jgi:ParB-like chromosome segregation protein Spo0J